MKRAEPTIRRKLIEALTYADVASTQKDKARRIGEAFAYATSLDVMAKVEGYVPVGGIAAPLHNYDPMNRNIELVEKFMAGDQTKTREILGLDEPVYAEGAP